MYHRRGNSFCAVKWRHIQVTVCHPCDLHFHVESKVEENSPIANTREAAYPKKNSHVWKHLKTVCLHSPIRPAYQTITNAISMWNGKYVKLDYRMNELNENPIWNGKSFWRRDESGDKRRFKSIALIITSSSFINMQLHSMEHIISSRHSHWYTTIWIHQSLIRKLNALIFA